MVVPDAADGKIETLRVVREGVEGMAGMAGG